MVAKTSYDGHEINELRKQAIIDASSAILLFKAELITRLFAAYRAVMPLSVYGEVTEEGYPGASAFVDFHDAGVFDILTLSSAGSGWDGWAKLGPALDPGERDAIQAFGAGLGDFIITDDKAAARYCRDNGIPYINALLVPWIFLASGRISRKQYRAFHKRLLTLGRYAPPVVIFAENCAEEKLDFFLP